LIYAPHNTSIGAGRRTSINQVPWNTFQLVTILTRIQMLHRTAVRKAANIQNFQTDAGIMISTKPVSVNAQSAIQTNLDAVSHVPGQSDLQPKKRKEKKSPR
jgi:hypothetical protein